MNDLEPNKLYLRQLGNYWFWKFWIEVPIKSMLILSSNEAYESEEKARKVGTEMLRQALENPDAVVKLHREIEKREVWRPA